MNKVKMVMLFILIIIGVIGLVQSKSKNTKEEVIMEEPQTKIALYYIDRNKNELVKEFRFVKLSEVKENMIGTIMRELIKGTTNKELESVIPKETKIRNIETKKNKIILDLTKDYLEGDENEVKKIQKIYSIVNTLTEITEINEVEIRVEGKYYTSKTRL